jgi:hypothetical protein
VVSVDNMIAIGLLLLTAGLMVAYSLPKRAGGPRLFRSIQALRRTRRSIGLSVEEGTRIHVSIGKSSVINPNNASGFVGLNTVERISQFSMISDRPPIATSGDGSLSILTQDTMRSAYKAGNVQDQYNHDMGRLTGPTPFSYIAGAIPVMRDETVSTNILVGSFGPEVGLLLDTPGKKRSFTVAGSESLSAQSVMYAAADEPLIGEEVFAVPAYLQGSTMQQASLRAQDILRLVLVIALVVGAVLKIAAELFGFVL